MSTPSSGKPSKKSLTFCLKNLKPNGEKTKTYSKFEFEFKTKPTPAQLVYETETNIATNTETEEVDSLNSQNKTLKYFKQLLANNVFTKKDIFFLKQNNFLDYNRLKFAVENETPSIVIRFVAHVEKNSDY